MTADIEPVVSFSRIVVAGSPAAFVSFEAEAVGTETILIEVVEV